MVRPVHFLIYLNRSGSTLLAQRLSQFQDIAVGLECRLGGGFFKNFYVENTEQLNYWLDQAYADHKFLSWNINRNSLYQALKHQVKPFRIDRFLKSALNEQFKDDPANVLIHKGREIFGDLEYYLQIFNDAKVIFIQRDPRAVYNSQHKSIDSHTKKPMQTDIVRFASSYKITKLRLNNYMKKKKMQGRLLVINYEDLIAQEEKELRKILDFLNIEGQKRNNQPNYQRKIPAEQQHLHKNVGKGNKKDRINAWQNELPLEDQLFLKSVLKNETCPMNQSNLSIRLLPWGKLIQYITRIFAFYYRTHPKILAKKTLVRLKLRKSI